MEDFNLKDLENSKIQFLPSTEFLKSEPIIMNAEKYFEHLEKIKEDGKRVGEMMIRAGAKKVTIKYKNKNFKN